ncbi:ABC transporter ATP-binding protein [Pseudomonas silvicola]|nr:ABC transporter ATP-binding protein [Pseudomonas silvicola]
MPPEHRSPCARETLIKLENISYNHQASAQTSPTLEHINLHILKGETCALLGDSGSGKSTLLNILGLLDRPSSGTYTLEGVDCTRATANQLASLRNHKIGFVFQSFNLLPRMNALDNVALPLLYRGVKKAEAQAQALKLITQVGLAHRALHRPDELSGGQKQRIAIARALIGNPSVILADEPTGNLDDEAAQDIVHMLLDLNLRHQVTVVIVTHDHSLATQFHRRFKIEQRGISEVRQS